MKEKVEPCEVKHLLFQDVRGGLSKSFFVKTTNVANNHNVSQFPLESSSII